MVNDILPVLEKSMNGAPYVEAMVGGGSIALALAFRYRELKIILNDINESVSNFWSVVSGCAGDQAYLRLRQQVEASRAPTDDASRRFAFWKQMSEAKPKTPGDKAFQFLFLNKTTYGGQQGGAPIGGKDQKGWSGRAGRGVVCQYTVDTLLQHLAHAHGLLQGRTEVYCLDAVAAVQRVGSCTAYFDPPYYTGKENNALYRKDMHSDEHIALAMFLKSHPHPWLVSYNDCPHIRLLYAWARIQNLNVRYSHAPGLKASDKIEGKKKRWTPKTELLILPSSLRTPVERWVSEASAKYQNL